MTRLYITNGPMKGQPFDLKGDTTFIGRGPNNDIQINNPSISRRHAKIIRKDDSFYIEDMRSHNGTVVNGNLIKPGDQVEVAEGIPVAIGDTFIALSKEAPADGMVTQYLINLSGEKGKTWKNLLYKDRRYTNRKNLELIYEVSNALMQSLDIDEICEKIMDSLFHSLSRIDSGVILLINKNTGEPEEIKAKSKKNQKSAEVKYSRTIVNRVIREGKAIMMSDTSSEDEDELSESIEIMKIKSIMCVPLISKSEILGVIYAHSVNVPHGFRKDDLFLFTGLSSPAALAIENALLYSKRKLVELALQKAHDQLEERVKDRTAELSKANTLLKQENFERKRAEETLKETNKFLRNILDSSTSFSIISTDLEQNILFWNRGAENIFGYKAEEMVGQQKIDILYTDETKRIMAGVRTSILKNKMGINNEVIEITKDGYTLWMNLYLSPSFDGNGNIVGILGIGVDISESKHLAAQLQQAQKMEAIGTLTSGVAHNFRNILAGILMSSQLIQMKYQDNPSLQEIIVWIISAAEKGSQLVKELMLFSRKQAEKEFRTLNLTKVIQETYQVICKSFDKKVAIRIDTPEFLFIKGDQSGLNQVFINLSTNARDAMPGGGELLIDAREERDKALVIVSDTGDGMDNETRDKCFDPFFTTKEFDRGTGLGLSTTYGIVKKHGGEIYVDSELGEGTTFKLYFPLAPSIKQGKQESNEIIRGKGQKVLIVDDDMDMLRPIKKLLTELGYDADYVSSGKEAIVKYKSWGPVVVLLDRNMPEMDGITCAEKIIEHDPNAKIVLMSGYEDEGPDGIDDKTKGFIKEYITKPINMAKLSQVLNSNLD